MCAGSKRGLKNGRDESCGQMKANDAAQNFVIAGLTSLLTYVYGHLDLYLWSCMPFAESAQHSFASTPALVIHCVIHLFQSDVIQQGSPL